MEIIKGYILLNNFEYSTHAMSEFSIVWIMSKFGLCPKQAKEFEELGYTERDLMRHIRCELLDKGKHNGQEKEIILQKI